MSVVQVPFQVPLEVNVVLIGFNGDGGYRYMLDAHKLEEFLRVSFPTHRPSCLETGEPLDIKHNIVFSAFPVSFTKFDTSNFLCLFMVFLVKFLFLLLPYYRLDRQNL
jgi:hypothetical protein